jgi:ubiquinone/menaquinone biosynthesis C-methylase UbiE
MNFEKPNNIDDIYSIEISEDVIKQLENLGLSPDEIKGSVLDIGAGEGQFAIDLENVTDAKITSIDNHRNEDTPDGVVTADVKNLPFEDNSFDMVISHASIPNVYVGMYSDELPKLSKKEMKKSVSESFREILRVLKPGSSATLAPVRIAQNYESERAISNIVQEEIRELQEDGIHVTFELIREEENPKNNKKSSFYRLSILKK